MLSAAFIAAVTDPAGHVRADRGGRAGVRLLKVTDGVRVACRGGHLVAGGDIEADHME